MRDPKRLYKFYNELQKIHYEFMPKLSFLQFICGFMRWTDRDPFFYEEDDILKAFDKWARENPQPGEPGYAMNFYDKFRDLHLNVPDWRFGQLMVNLIGWVRDEVEPDMTDEEFLKSVEKVMKQWTY